MHVKCSTRCFQQIPLPHSAATPQASWDFPLRGFHCIIKCKVLQSYREASLLSTFVIFYFVGEKAGVFLGPRKHACLAEILYSSVTYKVHFLVWWGRGERKGEFGGVVGGGGEEECEVSPELNKVNGVIVEL